MGVEPTVSEGLSFAACLFCVPHHVRASPGLVLLVDPPGVAPGFPACGASVLPVDDEPIDSRAEAVGLEPTSDSLAACFRDRLSSSRMTSVAIRQGTVGVRTPGTDRHGCRLVAASYKDAALTAELRASAEHEGALGRPL